MNIEDLKKEYYQVMEYTQPFCNEYHDTLFDWMWSKLEAKDKEIAEVDEQLQLYHQLITDLKAEIERYKELILTLKMD